MQRHKEVLQQSTSKVLSQYRFILYRRGRLFLAVIILTQAMLACAVTETGSRSVSHHIVILTRLPTFTRTPLPTLTPTTTSTPAAVAIVAESAEVTPSQSLGDDAVISETAVVASRLVLTSTPAPADISGSGEAAIAEDTSATDLSLSPADISTIDTEEQPIRGTEALANLPTATPTATLLPTSRPTATSTEIPSPTSTPTVTPTQTPIPEDWSFVGIRVDTDQYKGSLLLYGKLINNTESAQELVSVTGNFYDAQGQLLATADDTYALWPDYAIPSGKSIPFELIVDGVQNAANFDLSVEAEPSSEIVQNDFEFSDLNQWTEDDLYCVEGELQALSREVQDYLIITAVLYDANENIINFGEYQELGRIGLAGGDTSTFDICVSPPNHGVDRYELQAWGQ